LKIPESNKFYISVLTVLWFSLILIINPHGEFPFGDDFAYAGPVKHFLESGRIHITDWSSMTLVAWIYIGALTTWIFGFSFDVLRMTALVVAFAGVIGTYFLFTELSIKKSYAFICALIVGFHPIAYLLAFTFTTDYPFYSFITWTFYFYIKYFKNFAVRATALICSWQ
jgi:4-amino-4-deoxy-L-arabinose transferase-like glycosyltransferase